MVSKPNPFEDSEIRQRLYHSYIMQIPLWDNPGDFAVGKTIGQGGCYNCNAAFKLGSGYKKYAFNAYDAPGQYFNLPVRVGQPAVCSYPEYADPTGGRKSKKPKKTKKIHAEDYDHLKQEAEEDWYSLVKELTKLGFQLGDMVQIFYNKYQGKYGGDILHDFLRAKHFEDEAEVLGEQEYY